MASILSLRPKLFRTRSPNRDAATDVDRVMSVRRALSEAVSSATRERQGLQQRVDVYYAQASNLLDNSGDYGARSPEDEQSIAMAERQAAAANARIRQIDVQIGQFGDMLATLDMTMRVGAAAQ